MARMRDYIPGGNVVIRFVVGFAAAACLIGYLLSMYIEIDFLVAAETLGYVLGLSASFMFMKFGFSAFKFLTSDNDFRAHLISQWDRILGVSGWMMVCIGLISAFSGASDKMMVNASVAVYALLASYMMKGFIFTALYPNPDDDLFYVETHHTRQRKIETASEMMLH